MPSFDHQAQPANLSPHIAPEDRPNAVNSAPIDIDASALHAQSWQASLVDGRTDSGAANASNGQGSSGLLPVGSIILPANHNLPPGSFVLPQGASSGGPLCLVLPSQIPAQLPGQPPLQLPSHLPAQLPGQPPLQLPRQLSQQLSNQLPSQPPTQAPYHPAVVHLHQLQKRSLAGLPVKVTASGDSSVATEPHSRSVAAPRVANKPLQTHSRHTAAPTALVGVTVGAKSGTSWQDKESALAVNQVCCRVQPQVLAVAAVESSTGVTDHVTALREGGDSMAASEGASVQGMQLISCCLDIAAVCACAYANMASTLFPCVWPLSSCRRTTLLKFAHGVELVHSCVAVIHMLLPSDT